MRSIGLIRADTGGCQNPNTRETDTRASESDTPGGISIIVLSTDNTHGPYLTRYLGKQHNYTGNCEETEMREFSNSIGPHSNSIDLQTRDYARSTAKCSTITESVKKTK